MQQTPFTNIHKVSSDSRMDGCDLRMISVRMVIPILSRYVFFLCAVDMET